MSTQTAVPNPSASTTATWLARTGLSGKLLAIGALAGMICAFLPLLTMSVSIGFLGPAGSQTSTIIVARDWRGLVGLFAYLAAAILAALLYSRERPKGQLVWAGVAVGAVVLVLAIWLLVAVLITRSDAANLQDQMQQQSGAIGLGSFLAPSMAAQVSLGIGAFLNVAAAALVAAGAILKAREEKLF